MRKLWLERTDHVCARLMAIALALFLSLCAAPAARGETDGTIRVKLSRLGAPAAITMQADCDYTLASNPSARIPAGTAMTLSASGGKLALRAGDKTVALGASAALLRERSGSCGMRFTAPALSNRFCGDLAFTASGDVITTVLSIYVEDYLCGVVGCVMAPSSGLEALKAQAIAARNGALRQKTAHASAAYDVVDTDAALTFKGYSDAAEYADVLRAVEATRGGVLYYGENRAVCYYTDSNGGQIESAANAFGGALPYSAVADDPWDLASAAPRRTAEIRKDAQDLNPDLRAALIAGMADRLEALGLSSAPGDIRINSVERVTACDSRYPAPSKVFKSLTFQLNVTGRTAAGAAWTGSVSVSVPTFGGLERWYDLSINDADNETVWVSDVGAAFEITFRRSGHGVGMSQRGAQAMAREGASCADILAFYYPGASVTQLSMADAARGAGASAKADPFLAADPVASARLKERTELYEYADFGAAVLTVLPAGATVDVYAAQDGWAAVGSGGRYGFVPAEALTSAGEDDGGEAVAAADDQYARLTDDAGLYVNNDDAVSPKAMLARGSVVKLIAYNAKWAYVRTPGDDLGYVKRAFLAAVQGAPGEQDDGAIDGGPVTRAEGDRYLYVQAGALRLYASYSTDSQVLATLAEGDKVQLGAYNSKWACVRANGQVGFVLASGLGATPPADRSEAVEGGSVTKVSGEVYAVVTRSGAALYESWRAGAAELMRLAEGERVRVGAYNDRWACVRANGVTGYIPVEDLALAPDDEAADEPGGVSYLECDAVTTAPAQLFASADLNGEAVMPLEQGVVVHVYAFDERCAYVEIDGRRGFVALRWLKKLS